MSSSELKNYSFDNATRSTSKTSEDRIEILPTKIEGTYQEDYNILYVDEIIRKKLLQEKNIKLLDLKIQYDKLNIEISKPQTIIFRRNCLKTMQEIKNEINAIETGAKLEKYNNKVKNILDEYRNYNGRVKTITFDTDEEVEDLSSLDSEVRSRLDTINKFFYIASEYITIEVFQVPGKNKDLCLGCGESIEKVVSNNDGIVRCPFCQTEHQSLTTNRLSRDPLRINTNQNSEDETSDNFIKALIRYEGLQSAEHIDEKLFVKLDAYFKMHGCPSSEEIKTMPLNDRGRRGDTTHKMLWTALSKIKCSEFLNDTNLIAHLYWNWTLPVVKNKELVIQNYNKTQRVYYQIPTDIRGRSSSLGTQFRLWRELQLAGHPCYMDEFKIADNSESLRNHNRLWRMMTDAAGLVFIE